MKKHLIALSALLLFAIGSMPASAACGCKSNNWSWGKLNPFRQVAPCPCPATPCAKPCCDEDLQISPCMKEKPCAKPCPCDAMPCPAAPVQEPTCDDCCD